MCILCLYDVCAYVVSVCVCVICVCCMCTHRHTCVKIRKQLSGVLSFQHMGPRDQIQILRLAGKCSYLLSHLALGSFKTLNVVICYYVQTNTVFPILPF